MLGVSFLLARGRRKMESEYDAKMKDLAEQRKVARERALALERQMKKERKVQRAFLKHVKGISSQRLHEAAERARAVENSAAPASSG